MRAMTEWRRRLRQSGKFEGGKLMLFFGARTPQELPYFGPLQNLPKDFIDIHFAFSREPQKPKRYVQDAMRERAADLAPMLQDPQAYFYVCGLKSMEEGVVMALRDIATAAATIPTNIDRFIAIAFLFVCLAIRPDAPTGGSSAPTRSRGNRIDHR